MHFIEQLTGNNFYIDGRHLRPPVLAILLETIERENFDGNAKSINICQKVMLNTYSDTL